MPERRLLALLAALALAAAARAQVPACDALDPAQRRLAGRILTGQYLYDCGDRTVAECLQDTPACNLAVRLAGSVCRRVRAGQDSAAIARGLWRRARSMSAEPAVTAAASIDLDPAAAVGPDTAGVLVVEYACARCPFCARLTPALYREVVEGRLRGQVRFGFKAFPIRSHPFARQANLGLVAALALDRFWPFLLEAYGDHGAFSPERQVEWARTAGLDPDAFGRLMADPATAERLVAGKQEGLRLGVDATPTFFVNGRRYLGDLDLEELVDVLLEEADRVAGRRCLPVARPAAADPRAATEEEGDAR